MRFANHLAARTNASQPKPPIEYPKYIYVDGKGMLVQSEEEEREALGEPHEAEEKSAEEDPADPPQNLLSEPEKRPRGRPVGWRKPVLVPTESEE